GPQFTWQRGGVDERLDRVICNDDWVEIEVRNKFKSVLHNEEIIWRQKARLYGEQSGLMSGLPPNAFSCLSDRDLDVLNKEILGKEIKSALFDMAPLKSPTNNGYHALFYQSQWDHVGSSVCKWIKKPINLCSILYKLVMKIIVNRFKMVFSKIIAPEQTGFVAGRDITDNTIISQEVIHSMRSNQKHRKWMTIKIDLENEYDRVSWNGVPTRKFWLCRGFSPYLFILFMERLGQNIRSAIDPGSWTPIRLARTGPPLFHLFFVDDLIIFGHAEESQAKVPSIANLNMDYPLRDMVTEDGSWNLELFRLWVSEEVISRIKFQGPQHVRFFLGLTLKQRLLMNAERVRRGVGDDSTCGLCSQDFEEVLHVLSDCPALEKFGTNLFQEKGYLASTPEHYSNECQGFATTSGLVRDHNKWWMFDFDRYLGNCTISKCELWGILDGVKLISDHCVEGVLIQIDCLEAVNAIQEGSIRDSNSALIRKIHQLLGNFKHWKIQHIPKKENVFTNNLIKM
ncbi:hypothetical protein Goarm_000073, partial [Gossypium armourianum]|nr:hypothetical protein [Gossypium armourianum]